MTPVPLFDLKFLTKSAANAAGTSNRRHWADLDTPQPMSGFFLILVPLALLAVVIVLGLGLLNMARGGSPQRSQEFMRWRVILQLVALIVVMTALYFAAS
jgi:uncharacterized BrkB/YihY/UPF0761 family membrane protein